MGDSADDRFREMFYEEARELLIGLEEGLMDLERRQGDRAHLDKTFRAAHSLKGAAAMVGLGRPGRVHAWHRGGAGPHPLGHAGGRLRHHHHAARVARPSGGDGRDGGRPVADPRLDRADPAVECPAARAWRRPGLGAGYRARFPDPSAGVRSRAVIAGRSPSGRRIATTGSRRGTGRARAGRRRCVGPAEGPQGVEGGRRRLPAASRRPRGRRPRRWVRQPGRERPSRRSALRGPGPHLPG